MDFVPVGVGSLAAAHQGRSWFVLWDGVASFDCTWTSYDSSNTGGALADTCYTFAGGQAWPPLVCGGKCGGGLVEFDGDEAWTQHCGISSPNPLCMVKTVVVDEDNQIWLGSHLGYTYRGPEHVRRLKPDYLRFVELVHDLGYRRSSSH